MRRQQHRLLYQTRSTVDHKCIHESGTNYCCTRDSERGGCWTRSRKNSFVSRLFLGVYVVCVPEDPPAAEKKRERATRTKPSSTALHCTALRCTALRCKETKTTTLTFQVDCRPNAEGHIGRVVLHKRDTITNCVC